MSENETAASDVRGWATFVILGGISIAFVVPLVGLCFIAVGAFVACTTKVVEPAEVRMQAANVEGRQGAGCAWFALAAILIIMFGVLFLGAAGAMLGG